MAGLAKAQDDAGVAMSSTAAEQTKPGPYSIRAGSSLDVTPASGVSSMQTSPVKPELGDANDEATAKKAAGDQEMQKLREDFRNAMTKIEEMKLEAASDRAAFASERAARIREFGIERAARVQLEDDAKSWKHQYHEEQTQAMKIGKQLR